MAKRTIRLEDDEILRKKCKVVREITPNILLILEDMAETMYDANGVGLAAPQVGILRRIVTIDVGEGLVELINPEIIEERESQVGYEGCLSLPGKSSVVERPNYVKVRALDREGKETIVEGTEIMARALCHEIDHLDGILYTDKALDEDEYEELD